MVNEPLNRYRPQKLWFPVSTSCWIACLICSAAVWRWVSVAVVPSTSRAVARTSIISEATDERAESVVVRNDWLVLRLLWTCSFCSRSRWRLMICIEEPGSSLGREIRYPVLSWVWRRNSSIWL